MCLTFLVILTNFFNKVKRGIKPVWVRKWINKNSLDSDVVTSWEHHDVERKKVEKRIDKERGDSLAVDFLSLRGQ